MVSTSDIKTTGWIRHLPPLGQALAQLARIDRPIGWWLLLLPGWQAIILAGITQDAPLSQVLHLMVLFLVGAIVMRGAGCVINDLWDRDLDRAVARTRDRPLASGQVSVKTAFGFLASLAVIGVLVLIQLPLKAMIVGIASLPLIIVYPLAKRFTGLPQIVLALTFSWGALLGWASLDQWPSLPAFLLYAASALWVFGYDTIYAIQDMADDASVGIKSSALTLGRSLPMVVALTYGGMVLFLLAITLIMPLGWAYLGGLAGLALHLSQQIRRIDRHHPALAGAIFRSNRDAGLILVAGLMAEYLMR